MHNPRCDSIATIDPIVGAAGAAALCAVLAQRLPTSQSGEIASEPALTPLLLVAEKQLQPELRTWRPSDTPALSYLFGTVSGTAIVALFAILALPGWRLSELALSIFPVAALFMVYVAFIPRTVESRFLPYLDVDEDIVQVSNRVVVILVAALGVELMAFGVPRIIDLAIPMLLLGLAKASAWYFTFQTARHTSWCIAGAIRGFAMVASSNPFIQLSATQAIAPVLASILALGQLMAILPKQLKGGPVLWALILIPLVPYLANCLAIRVARSWAVGLQEHPVGILIRNAQADFEQLLQRQSKTYTAAVHEYQRRYGVEPPPGFEAWYEFAAANQSPIIDDFDTIYYSVLPFWSLSGREVLQIIDDAHNTPDIDLWLCSFSGDTAETRCTHPRRNSDRHISDLFNTLLGDVRGVLPDVRFLVNHLDEPRVLVPPASQQADKRKLTVSDLSEQPTWKAVTKHCGLQAQQLRDLSPQTEEQRAAVDTHGLPLVTNRSTALNLCQHPEYAATHGLFQAPPSFRLIEGRVPVLSPGRPSTMSDILFPSPAYLVEPEFRYNATADIPWSQKSNHLYWTGSTTGAVRLYEVFPTRIFQCAHPLPCREQAAHFRSVPWQDRDAALHAKLVFDLDGNGISGRFYKLLASGSLVLKQTLLREWHDDRLVPWAHYVPISVDMGEVPEVVHWFLESEKGREKAREVAEGGKEWFARAMREVDVKIYVWRLLLELARVVDEGREALAKVGEGDG
ncbi:hypothetical protein C8A03DRAFT_19270 [Achaetomium macrosporum]|uniref:Glycosyl transferase CAP10 domain-containing protein n=1 Tax=Achaetomium macrosporum TaxID=79813 RepID=A0AAN7C1X2_9PEZI|nr:hypothetical protein C8A03DRAFT_19270 [Achaetomium macrosporum]